MDSNIHPYLTEPDIVVLKSLFQDVNRGVRTQLESAEGIAAPEILEEKAEDVLDPTDYDRAAIAHLKALNDPCSPEFRPTVFVSWDDKDMPEIVNRWIVRPYAKVASSIVRHPTDVVFLTHILMYFTINLPSAILLYYNFTYIHGIAHAAFTFWCAGSFTLMMHNHIHNHGVLTKTWYWLDSTFPYLMEPLFGHTWDSYYYHHVKHHHVEANGPDDLSSTIRYQRDDVFHLLHYIGRFILLVWYDLPMYFVQKGKPQLAVRAFCSELASIAFLYYMTFHVHKKASAFVLIIPFILLRLGLMIGNWGQHALVDEVEPDSDFRSSITLIDVPSNRFCFNDGYHTAHHLNPRRHWREQPVHFVQSKEAYRQGRALVFHNIDYLMMTYRLVTKDYMTLAKHLVPIGDQIGMTQAEIADMLRTKTRRFTEEDIQAKFNMGPTGRWKQKQTGTLWSTVTTKFARFLRGALGPKVLDPCQADIDMDGHTKIE